MNVHIPSTREIHMIAYLTLHGWEPHYDDVSWHKAGMVRNLTPEEEWAKESDDYHLQVNKPDLEVWSLEQAYNHEQDLQMREKKE